MTILGTICGVDSWTEICEFAEAKLDWLKTFLELPNGVPSHDTFGRVFSLLDAGVFEECFLLSISSLSIDLQNEIISIDIKSLRGSHNKRKEIKMLHVVSAWASENKILLGQVKTNEKSNEITAIPEFLDVIDVADSIVTIDAMGCQQEIAKKVVEKGADYVLSLKENQPTLYQDVQNIFFPAEEGEKNNRKTLMESKRRILAETEKRGHTLKDQDINKFMQAVRKNWNIEINLHWSLDVIFKEDLSRVRIGNASENLTIIRRLL